MQVRYKQDTGVIVWTVDVHKAAWAAGLRAGDVLHSIDGQVLESIDHLLERLFEVEVGGVISMEVRGRGSKPEPKPEPKPEHKPEPNPERLTVHLTLARHVGHARVNTRRAQGSL